MIKHPAKFTEDILSVAASCLYGNEKLIDPFGGIGGVFRLLDYYPNLDITCLEIEPEWAMADRRIIVGDAMNTGFADDSFDVCFTSPPYGNRMADKLSTGKWAFTRNTYAAYLGRELSEHNIGAAQWGDKYREPILRAWLEVNRVLKRNGRIILNTKNHIRGKQLIEATEWHLGVFESLGFTIQREWKIYAKGLRRGRNYSARVDFESIHLLSR